MVLPEREKRFGILVKNNRSVIPGNEKACTAKPKVK